MEKDDLVAAPLPPNCTFTPSDWRSLAPFWYPVAFSHEVDHIPFAAQLLDQRLVLYRLPSGAVTAAQDLCPHRGVPLSRGWTEGDDLVCAYHGLRYGPGGHCVSIPSHPQATISARLKLRTYGVQEHYGLIWVRLLEDGPRPLPEFKEWDHPDYLQVLPDSVTLKASAGRQVEGFLDVSHFAFVHRQSFGQGSSPKVPDYPVTPTATGFRADYISTVSNYPVHLKHLNPPGFQWRRLFEVFLPFTARLTVFFPHQGQLHILNAACPVSARLTRVFVPICRNFDRQAPLQDTLDFNHQVFEEDRQIVEQQYPQDLPLNLSQEVHIRADRSSICYRQKLAALGLGQSFTA